MIEALSKMEPLQAGDVAKKMIFKNYEYKKIAFLMAFNKVGFDMFEVAKLMTTKDNKELSVKKFVLKNQDILLLTGTMEEIISNQRLSNLAKINDIIKHIELNYQFYLTGKTKGL